MTFLRNLVLAAIMVASPAAVAASFGTSGETARISRVRLDSLGRVFVNVTQTPTAATNDCPPSIQSELYWFDSTTLQGRILYNQVLAAYSSQSKVSGSATGTCLLIGSIIVSRYQPLTSLTVFTP